jgi:hypothetical protein
MSSERERIERDVAGEPSTAREERRVPETEEPQEPPGTERGNAQYDENTLEEEGLKPDR